MTVLVIITFVIIIIIDVPRLIRNRYQKELIVFSGLMAFAFLISVLRIKGYNLPNPVEGMQYVIKDILHINYR